MNRSDWSHIIPFYSGCGEGDLDGKMAKAAQVIASIFLVV